MDNFISSESIVVFMHVIGFKHFLCLEIVVKSLSDFSLIRVPLIPDLILFFQEAAAGRGREKIISKRRV